MIQPIDDNRSNVNEISLKEIILKLKKWWRFLLSKWIIILIAGIIGGTLGLANAWSKKTTYIAELSFALEDEKSNSNLNGALGLASQFGLDLGSSGGSAFAGENLMELMKSRSIIEKALLSEIELNNKKASLVELYISFNKMREDWQKDQQLKNIVFPVNPDRSKFSLKQDSILGEIYNQILQNNLTVDKKDKKLSIISIKVNSINELFSKIFVERLAETVSNFYIDTKTKKSVQNVNILQKQTDSVRRALNSAISGVANSTDANPNANPLLLALKVPTQRRQYDVQANTAILNQLVANLELAKVSLRKETPLIQVIDKPILPLKKEKLGKLKGLLVGGTIGVLLASTFLLFKKLFQDLLKD